MSDEIISPEEIVRRNNLLRNLFGHLEKKMRFDITPREEALKLKIYSHLTNVFPDIVLSQPLEYVEYNQGFFEFYLGEVERVSALCSFRERRPMIQNPNMKNVYLSVPAEQFGMRAEVRVGWFG